MVSGFNIDASAICPTVSVVPFEKFAISAPFVADTRHRGRVPACDPSCVFDRSVEACAFCEIVGLPAESYRFHVSVPAGLPILAPSASVMGIDIAPVCARRGDSRFPFPSNVSVPPLPRVVVVPAPPTSAEGMVIAYDQLFGAVSV